MPERVTIVLVGDISHIAQTTVSVVGIIGIAVCLYLVIEDNAKPGTN